MLTPEPRYCDYYSTLSYADFLENLEAGTLLTANISLGKDIP
jgi:hypothetical protein